MIQPEDTPEFTTGSRREAPHARRNIPIKFEDTYDVQPRRFTRRGKVLALATAGVALFGAGIAVNSLKTTIDSNIEITQDYQKAHKTITYDSPANPNDAPDTPYSNQLPAPTSTELSGVGEATQMPVELSK